MSMMPTPSHSRWCAAPAEALLIVLLLVVVGCSSSLRPAATATPATPAPPAPSGASLIQLSTDTFGNGGVYHHTEVEPDTYAFGATIVATFQVGRSPGPGSTDAGWATSSNNGAAWSKGLLPHLTKDVGGAYDRAGDPSVAYDAKHGAWLIVSVATLVNGQTSSGLDISTDVVVSRSTNGGFVWSDPILVAHGDVLLHPYDKPWLVCDTWAASPHYGNCYVAWAMYDNGVDAASGSSLVVSMSINGGQTWSATPSLTAARDAEAQPLVQPSGTVIIPYCDATDIPGDTAGKHILSIISSDGGAHWSSPVIVSPLSIHVVLGQMRALPLPSAEIDAAGTVYVVWQDCALEPGCATNDLVLTSSSDGVSWSPVQRIPIHAPGSGFDEFIPGLAVDRTTSGATAHLGVAYYFYPNSPAACNVATCQLSVGWVQSHDAGNTWTNEVVLAGPMHLTWLPKTADGYMVGDYISTSFSQKQKAFPVFAVAHMPNGPQCAPAPPVTCDEAMYTVKGGL
jgi:hypothetical protein